MNTIIKHDSLGSCTTSAKFVLLGLATVLAMIISSAAIAASSPPKCGVGQSLVADPGWTVTVGTLTTLTQTVSVTSPSTTTDASAKCGQATGAVVTGGANQQIQAVTLGDDGPGYPCADLGNSYCSAGTIGAACGTDADCDTVFDAGDGVCAEVVTSQAVKNPPFGVLTYDPDTSAEGVFGFRAQYQGGGDYDNAPTLCEDLTVIPDEECSGATITIDRADGPGEPTAPGGPYDWKFVVTVHACEDLYGVSAQGGTNGWAQLKDRSKSSLFPSYGDADIRKQNRKTDVILWMLGDMTAGQTETLEVQLRGSIKNTPDCQELFLSGAWSALFSTDGFLFEKSDYTGRVSIFTNSNGVLGDCGP